MIFKDVILSYPCVKHDVEVSHFTARKSTAIEWVILESISKCEKLTDYMGISIATFFEQIFTISDADALIRPVLISLQDIGAISISEIDDETELSSVTMEKLKLTDAGREMQSKGLLPGTSSDETFSVYYEIATGILRDEGALYKEEPTGICVLDEDMDVDDDDSEIYNFPEGEVRQWLLNIQRDRKHKNYRWLTPTTNITSVEGLDSELFWRNVTRKIEITEGMKWKISGENNEKIDEITLNSTDTSDARDLPFHKIVNPDEEIKKLISFTEINSLIAEFMQKDELFCVSSKYYKGVKNSQQNKKKIKIGIVYGGDEFKIEKSNKQMIIRVPNIDLESECLYFNKTDSIRACTTKVSAGTVAKDLAIAYIPNNNDTSLPEVVISIVQKYYLQDNNIIFALIELGLKQMFLDYAEKIFSTKVKIADKSHVIDILNEKSREYYGQNIISAQDKAKLLVNEQYIINHCNNIKDAKAVIKEYSEINAFKQDESLFQNILKIVLENVGQQDSLEDIWDFWQTISSVKKSYLIWIDKLGLYKSLYSQKSIKKLFERFTDEGIVEIEEYTAVEQIILDMRRISLHINELIPEINLYKTVSVERYNEIVVSHRDVIDQIYDLTRKFHDDEEKFTLKVMNFDEILEPDSAFNNFKQNVDGLKNALATFFDDSFMKFSKIYILDTCTLMSNPGVISTFEDGKALLVIPLIVLNELDGLKESEDGEKAYNAREAIRNIRNYQLYEWLDTEEKSHPELLPYDLDKEKNDFKILSIAIKYCAKKPILLTDDINLGNIATANRIDTMTLESYNAMKQHEEMVNKEKKGNKNYKKSKNKKR